MNEKSKAIFLELKENNKDLSDSFNEYVDNLAEKLDIPRDIAVTLVTTELVNKYEKQLILKGLFSKMTLDEYKNKLSGEETL